MSIRRERYSTHISPLDDPRDSLVTLGRAFRDHRLDRRDFLQRAGLLLTGLALSPIALSAKESDIPLEKTEWREDPWWTMQEVQEHLFPSEPDAPGAKSIQSAAYLKRELASPKVPEDEKKLLVDGVRWLNDLAELTHSKPFVELNWEQREAVLRQTEQSQTGQRWISLTLYYILEALLTDPIYGGNPDGSGWKWLNHHVGFPRPTKEKIYSEL